MLIRRLETFSELVKEYNLMPPKMKLWPTKYWKYTCTVGIPGLNEPLTLSEESFPLIWNGHQISYQNLNEVIYNWSSTNPLAERKTTGVCHVVQTWDGHNSQWCPLLELDRLWGNVICYLATIMLTGFWKRDAAAWDCISREETPLMTFW